MTAFLISGISATEPALVGEPYVDGSGNRAAVASVPAAELDFAGIALHANRKTVDKVLDKLCPHP